jgi:hypothetical protein
MAELDTLETRLANDASRKLDHLLKEATAAYTSRTARFGGLISKADLFDQNIFGPDWNGLDGVSLLSLMQRLEKVLHAKMVDRFVADERTEFLRGVDQMKLENRRLREKLGLKDSDSVE